jgi:hypothetical protein
VRLPTLRRRPRLSEGHDLCAFTVRNRPSPAFQCLSLLLIVRVAVDRFRCLRAWSTSAAVSNFAGSNSATVKPSSHDSWLHFWHLMRARRPFQLEMSTRSEPHWPTEDDGHRFGAYAERRTKGEMTVICSRIMASKRRLYKLFSDERYAHAFMAGELRFRSLAYFRDYEDAQVRGDGNEGTAIMRPVRGLEVLNRTQHTKFLMENAAFQSSVKSGEIFVHCLSKSDTETIRRRFDAVACVEITDISEFCRRAEKALVGATFPGRPGHQRIGQHVDYYDVIDGATPRWALPDVIASSKLKEFAWQDEFRLVFSVTDALSFEKVELQIVQGESKRAKNLSEHDHHDVRLGGLRDIAQLHKIAVPLTA